MMTRRTFCLLAVGFLSGLMNADEDDEDEPPTRTTN